jgi:hypothetical protein
MNITAGRNDLASSTMYNPEYALTFGFDSKYCKFRNVILSLFLGLHFSFNQIPDNQNSCPVIWSQRTFFDVSSRILYFFRAILKGKTIE